MKHDSLFGSTPKRLKALAALGLEDSAEEGNLGDVESLAGPFLEKVGDWIGPYKLVSVLGEGGMGIVYLAEQSRPIKRPVALKLVKPGMDSKKVMARFEAEQQALAVMDHPHVARVYDAGLNAAGRPYFVMEYVEGLPITGYCDQQKMTIEQRLTLFLQVCAAVQHAHQKGIIHRDLKPSNILVSDLDGQAAPKVIDFGIAKALNQSLAQSLTDRTLYTEQGQFVGTPEYMSPEQAEPTARGIDTRTDIYSLGVVLYELLAGVLPFDADTLRDGGPEHIKQVICDQDPKTPSTRLSTVSGEISTKLASLRRTDTRSLGRRLHGDLDWIVIKALEKDPKRRYATAHALAEDIERHLRHEPITAGAPGLIYRLRKYARRHRIAVIFGIGVVILFLLGLLSANLYRQKQAREALLEQERQARRTQQAQLEQERRARRTQQAQADLLAAETAFTGGRYQQALLQVDQSLEDLPDPLHAKLIKTHILWAQDKTDDALALLKNLEREHPEEGSVYELLAMIYAAQGREQLYTRYHQLAQRFPAHTAESFIIRAIASETLEARLSLLSEALGKDRDHYQARRMRSLTHLALGDYHLMERDAEELVFMQPDNPAGHALRAVALQRLQQYAEALIEHDRAIELAGDSHPDIGEFYDQRRETLFRLGEYERAAEDARECVRREPNDVNYGLGLYSALIALGRYEHAEQQYETSNWTVLRFPCWLAKYVTESRLAGKPLSVPTDQEAGGTARLLRSIQRRQAEVQSKARRLVAYGSAADYSPDGRLLAYARFNPDNMWGHQTPLARPDEPGSKGIEILDIEQGTVRRLVSFGHYPRWSPDGRHIAFVKTPYCFREPWSEKTYIVPAAGGEPRHLCDQVLLSWSQDARYIYTFRAEDSFVYKWDITNPTGDPERIIHSPCYFPEISPDETRIAFQHRGYIVVQEISTCRTLARWRLPILPGYREARWHWRVPPNYEPIPLAWSPTGHELSIGSEWGHFGLWIYDLRTQTAARVLRGTAPCARWSADGTKMALVLGSPDWEIWQADLDPGRPSIASLGSCLTETEHCQQTLEELNNDIVLTAPDLRPTVQGRVRAFCSAGLGQPEGVTDGLAQWHESLRVLPGKVCEHAPTYWDMATPLLDRYAAKTGKPDDLLTLAQDMAPLAPQLWSGQVLTGMALYRAGAYEQALETLKQADILRIESEGTLHPEQLTILAMTLHRLGREKEAFETLESLRSLYLQPCPHDVLQPLVNAEKTFAESNESLCRLWEHVSAGHLNQALALLQEMRRSLIENDPTIMASLSSAGLQMALQFTERGQGYERRREYIQAMRHYESAARAAPGDASIRYTLARFQLYCPDATLRDPIGAIENATQACELDNWTQCHTMDTLAAAHAAGAQFKEAVRYQEKVIASLPADISSGSHRRQALKLALYKSGQAYHGQALSGPGLVAHYRFEGKQAGTALDASGNELHGTFVGDACIVDDPERGKVLSVDGQGDWVDCGDDYRFDLSEEHTISIWCKIKLYTSAWEALIGKGNNTWRITRDGWRNALQFAAGPGLINIDEGLMLADDKWHHVVGVNDGSTLRLYLDGRLDSSTPLSGRMTPNESPLLVGAVHVESQRASWKGFIDDVRIYNYALSEKAVQDLLEGIEPIR